MSVKTPALLELRNAVRFWFQKLDANSKVCIGVSGGADSLALAIVAKLEAADFNLDLVAVIVDHNLQENSAEVAASTKKKLKSIGYSDIFVGKANVVVTDGIEASARRARHLVFQQALETYGAKVFLLGHTKNDQAEGVLLGLARGSGTKSLSGMAEISGLFIRPFLNVDRSTTQAACDESGIIDALSRSAKILREDATALDEWAERVFGEVDPADIEISLLADLPIAVRSRVLRLAIYAAGAPSGSISATHLAPIEAFVSDWRGQGHTSLPGGVKVCRISGRLSLSKP